MKALIIDTATDTEIVACINNGSSRNRAQKSGVSHAGTLFASIDESLRMTKTVIGDLDFLAVGMGPGSFTGIRIAVTTMRMLAQVNGLPLYPIPSHLIYALSALTEHSGQCAVIFDARKGKIFAAMYERRNGNIICSTEPGDYTIDEFLSKSSNEPETIVVGNGAGLFPGKISGFFRSVSVNDDYRPDATHALAYIAESSPATPHRDLTNHLAVLPDYQRESDAVTGKRLKGRGQAC